MKGKIRGIELNYEISFKYDETSDFSLTTYKKNVFSVGSKYSEFIVNSGEWEFRKATQIIKRSVPWFQK